MSREHETPLVIWSNRGGAVKDIGAVSPAFVPLHVLRSAGIKHPYYTGFLGRMLNQFRVIDRNMLIGTGRRGVSRLGPQEGDRPGDPRFPAAAIRHDVRQAGCNVGILPRTPGDLGLIQGSARRAAQLAGWRTPST